MGASKADLKVETFDNHSPSVTKKLQGDGPGAKYWVLTFQGLFPHLWNQRGTVIGEGPVQVGQCDLCECPFRVWLPHSTSRAS